MPSITPDGDLARLRYSLRLSAGVNRPLLKISFVDLMKLYLYHFAVCCDNKIGEG